MTTSDFARYNRNLVGGDFSGGAYGSQKANPQVTVLGGRRLASMYRCPAIDVETFCAYTNHVPCTQTRTPGSPQIAFAFESQVDIIAKEMDIEPLEFRRRNILHDGDASPMGEKWNHILMSEVLERVAKASGWKKTSRKKNRGWGMALYERGTPEGKASAAITLEADGKANILTGVPDVGPGFYTVIQQMVCETLGIAPQQVVVSFKDTDSLPFDPGTGGSKQTKYVRPCCIQSCTGGKGEISDTRGPGARLQAGRNSPRRTHAHGAEQKVNHDGKDDRAGGQE